MLWWHWVVLGLILVGLELMTPGGFFIVFFGLGAFVVGVLVGVGGVETPWLQWLDFSILSIVSLILFRNPLLRRMQQHGADGKVVDSLVDETAIASEEIAPGGVGRAELRGSTWRARNVGSEVIGTGARCRVVRVDGLILEIRPEGGD